jgi:hypothetical protein
MVSMILYGVIGIVMLISLLVFFVFMKTVKYVALLGAVAFLVSSIALFWFLRM